MTDLTGEFCTKTLVLVPPPFCDVVFVVTLSVIELLEFELANIVVDGLSGLEPSALCRGVTVFLGVAGQFFGVLLGDVLLPFFTVSPPTIGGLFLYLWRLLGEL